MAMVRRLRGMGSGRHREPPLSLFPARPTRLHGLAGLPGSRLLLPAPEAIVWSAFLFAPQKRHPERSAAQPKDPEGLHSPQLFKPFSHHALTAFLYTTQEMA